MQEIKTENRKDLKVRWLMIAAVLLLVSGFVLFFASYKESKKEFSEHHEDHLKDIVKLTDRSMYVYISRCRSELEFSTKKLKDSLDCYFENGESGAMETAMQNALWVQDDSVQRVLLVDKEKVLLSTEDTDDCNYEFPVNSNIEYPLFCKDGQNNLFITIITDSGYEGVYYAALIAPDVFFRKVIGTESGEYYWLGLYNSDNAVFFQSDLNQPLVRMLTKEEVAGRGDGISVMLESENENRMLMETYFFSSPFDGKNTEYQICALPRALTKNQEYTIGVSIETAHYQSEVWKILTLTGSSLVLILIGFLIFAILIYTKNTELLKNQTKINELERELDALEELSHHQRLEMIGAMTGGIAHELRNILTPIMGYSVMAMNAIPEENEELMNELSQIYDSSLHAKNLVSRLLALSYKNNDRVLHKMHADEIIEDVLAISMPIIPENVQLEKELSCAGVFVRVDQSQMLQVFMNIVRNAVQAMENTGGILTVSSALYDGKVTYKFSDTGKGIPEDVLPRIFEPFFSTKGVEKGTGIGLAIVKHIVTEHGGSVEAESAEGKGTVITVRLNAVEDEE